MADGSIERIARQVARRQAGPGASEAEQREHRERVEAVLRGEETMPVSRYVQVTRQEGDETAPNGEPFHVRIKASTEGVARDGGIVPLRAWQDGGLQNFRKNPVVMLAHGREFPIGVSVHDELDPGEDALVAWWRFHEENEESRLAKRLYEGGWMRAASVGFRILDFRELNEGEVEELQEELGTQAEIRWVAERAELLEQSAVAVPADPEALTTAQFGRAVQNAKAHGVDVEPLVARMGQLAQRCSDGDAEACERLAEMRDDEPDEGHRRDEEPERQREVISFEQAHDAGSYEVAEQDAEWDAAEELDAMEAAEEPLTRRHAWRDPDGDPETKTAYSFPHHRAGEGAAVVFRALAQMFARIDQADIPDSDKDGVLDHAARHYRADFDQEPPERQAVLEARDEYPEARRRWEGERQHRERVQDYVREHGETLTRLGGGDMKTGAEVIEDIARELEEEGDAELTQEERLARLEEGMVELQSSVTELRETMEAVREQVSDEPAKDEPAGDGDSEPDADEGDEPAAGDEDEPAAADEGGESEPDEPTAEEEEEEEDDEPAGADEGEPAGDEEPEHAMGFDPDDVTVEEQDGERLAVIPRGEGEEPIGVPLKEGEDPEDVIREAVENGLLMARGGAVRGGAR